MDQQNIIQLVVFVTQSVQLQISGLLCSQKSVLLIEVLLSPFALVKTHSTITTITDDTILLLLSPTKL